MHLSLASAMRPFRRRGTSRQEDPPTVARVETVVFGAFVPLVLVLLAPAPFRAAAAGFVVLCPLVLGLKHGQKSGLSGAALCAAALALACAWNAEAAPEYPKVSAVAGLLAGLVSGRSRDRREARLRQLWSSCEYHRVRLAEQHAAYAALQLAHADLQRKLGSRCELRTTLERLQRECEQVGGGGTDDAKRLGGCILDLFRQAAPLHSAALFLCDAGGGLARHAAAAVGGASTALAAYPQVPRRLAEGLEAALPEELAPGEPLAVLPLHDAHGQLQGALVIVDMAFEAIGPETFERLGVLARHAAHSLARRVRPLATGGDLRSVRAQLGAAVEEARHAGMALSVLTCECPAGVEPSAFLAQCVRSGRTVDRTWAAREPGGPAVVVKLLPLTDPEGVACFARRLGTALADRFPGAQLASRAWTFRPDDRDDPMPAVHASLAALVAHGAGGPGARA